MRTLIDKRTHPGDPDHKGRFGIEDCMGQVRIPDHRERRFRPIVSTRSGDGERRFRDREH